jgi:hypothetical protein
MKKRNKAPANWETKRANTVATPAFIKLFEKACARMASPTRKTCKHGHKISAANAHVGDLKRLGTYACDPCNRLAQVRYIKTAAKKSSSK